MMEDLFTGNTYQLPVYRKALEIFRISRAIAGYFSKDRHVIEMDISANPTYRHAGFLVTQSLQLAPGIAMAASAPSSATRLQRMKKIKILVQNLSEQCRNLEFLGVKEVEFLRLLRKEIHQFEKLLSDWIYQNKG